MPHHGRSALSLQAQKPLRMPESGKDLDDECWRSVQPYGYADLQSQLMRTGITIGETGLHRPHGITVMIAPIPRQQPKLQKWHCLIRYCFERQLNVALT
jgi:hypothetical protein